MADCNGEQGQASASFPTGQNRPCRLSNLVLQDLNDGCIVSLSQRGFGCEGNERKVMASPLEQEFKYYLDHQGELVKKYNGKFVVIKDRKVIGSYDSQIEAVQESVKTNPLGTFLVQKCEPGKDSYTQTFHSRVAFA